VPDEAAKVDAYGSRGTSWRGGWSVVRRSARHHKPRDQVSGLYLTATSVLREGRVATRQVGSG